MDSEKSIHYKTGSSMWIGVFSLVFSGGGGVIGVQL